MTTARIWDTGEPGKWTTLVTVVSQEQYDGGPFYFGESYEAGSLDGVIDSLNQIREAIPEEYRASATCEITSVGGYEDSHYATITVEYKRPATDAEIEAEIRRRAAGLAARHSQERAVRTAALKV